MPTPNSNRLDKGLAFSNDRCDNYYVMSTTRQVVKEAHVELGHFSDPLYWYWPALRMGRSMATR
jgi:hypothetical protein